MDGVYCPECGRRQESIVILSQSGKFVKLKENF